MLTFLRRIRRSLIDSGATRKYLLYAIGEIALVVIGILIAVQINNWNEAKKARTREVTLLYELKSNLLINSDRLKKDIEIDNQCFISAKIIVDHLDRKLPYHDTLAQHFQLSQLSADIILATSAYEAIKSIGFDMVTNDSLRNSIIELFDSNYGAMVRNTRGLEDLFWPSVALPLGVKHLRDLSMDEDNSGMRPINYDAMLVDTEFTSMLSTRGIFRRQAVNQKKKSLIQTESLIKRIEQELNN